MESDTIALIAALVLVVVALAAVLLEGRSSARRSRPRTPAGHHRLGIDTAWHIDLVERAERDRRARARHAARDGEG